MDAGAIPGHVVCDTDRNAGINGDVGAAKEYLNGLPKRPFSQCAPPTKENIQHLNSSFAVCAAAFFKAYTAQYGTVYITSAYRDLASGANACAGGAPNSNHTRGLAIDVNPAKDSLYPTMWKFAYQNPQFGVCFPYQDGSVSGYHDRPHMVLAGIGGREGALCAAQAVTKACSAGMFTSTPTAPPTTGPGTVPTVNPNGAPTCPSGSILINNQCYILPPPTENETDTPQLAPVISTCPLTGPGPTVYNCNQPQQPIQCPQGYIFIGNQCTPFSPQQNLTLSPSRPGFPSGGTNPSSSQPTQSGIPGTPNSSGTIIPSTVPSSILGQLNRSGTPNLNAMSSTSTINDLINALANPTSASGSTTNTPSNTIAVLNPDIAHIATITNGNCNQNTNQNTQSNTTGSPSNPTTTISSLIPAQTFTSGTDDTSTTANSSYTPTSYTTPFQDALASLQSALNTLLNYLQSLAGNIYL